MDNTNLRILDANFNRAREALRVMEEFVRFHLNDSHLTSLAKNLRHDLAACLNQLPHRDLLAARDILGDVGTAITTPGENLRQNAFAVAQAAAKRLTEALRCLEEYTKINSPPLAVQLQALRYRSYQLEKLVISRTDISARLFDIRLYVLLTESLCSQPILATAEAVLAGGADCIQLREKDKSDKDLLVLAREICRLCRKAGAFFIMNDRPDLAVLADADGLHLGCNDLPIDQARKILASHQVIGCSTHSLAEAQSALDGGADYLAVGCIFPSPTKPQLAHTGPELIQQIKTICDRPLIAIGGITVQNAAQAFAAGATAVALCQSIISQPDPAQAARSVKQIIIQSLSA